MPRVNETLNAVNAYINQSDIELDFSLQDFENPETNEYKFRYPMHKSDVLKELEDENSEMYKNFYKYYRQYSKFIKDCNSFKKFISNIIFGDVRPNNSSFRDQKGLFTCLRLYKIRGAKPELNIDDNTIELNYDYNKIWLCESAIELCVTALIKAGNFSPKDEDVRSILQRYNHVTLTSQEIINLFTYGIAVIKRRVIDHAMETTYFTNLGQVYLDRVNNLRTKFQNSMCSYFYNASTDTLLERKFTQYAEKTLTYAGLRDKCFKEAVRTQSPILRSTLTILDRMFCLFRAHKLQCSEFKEYFDAIYNNLCTFGKQSNTYLVKICKDLKTTFDTIFNAQDQPTLIKIVNSWMNSAIKTDRSIVDTIKVYVGYAIYKMLTSKIALTIYKWIENYKNDKIEPVKVETIQNYDMLNELNDYVNRKFKEIEPLFDKVGHKELRVKFVNYTLVPLMKNDISESQLYVIKDVFDEEFETIKEKLKHKDIKWLEKFVDNLRKRMNINVDSEIEEDF